MSVVNRSIEHWLNTAKAYAQTAHTEFNKIKQFLEQHEPELTPLQKDTPLGSEFLEELLPQVNCFTDFEQITAAQISETQEFIK